MTYHTRCQRVTAAFIFVFLPARLWTTLCLTPFHAHLFDITYLSLPLANYLVTLYIHSRGNL